MPSFHRVWPQVRESGEEDPVPAETGPLAGIDVRGRFRRDREAERLRHNLEVAMVHVTRVLSQDMDDGVRPELLRRPSRSREDDKERGIRAGQSLPPPQWPCHGELLAWGNRQ